MVMCTCVYCIQRFMQCPLVKVVLLVWKQTRPVLFSCADYVLIQFVFVGIKMTTVIFVFFNSVCANLKFYPVTRKENQILILYSRGGGGKNVTVANKTNNP